LPDELGPVAAGKYVALALASPHAYLTFLALYANLGTGVADDLGPDADLNPERAEAALLAMTEHVALGPAEQADWDSIALHDAMSTTDDVVFCPCEFGYATYGETDNTNRLAFSAFAGPRAPHERGAVLGGAAIGISARTRLRAPALDFVRYLLTPETQALLSARHGQAAYAPIWSDAAVDARFNGYFSSVRSTIDSASIRPRFADFIPFQLKAGNIVRAAAIGEMSISAALERLQQLTDEARAATA
jgi:multiple sugar transport system substrate-binding protein